MNLSAERSRTIKSNHPLRCVLHTLNLIWTHIVAFGTVEEMLGTRAVCVLRLPSRFPLKFHRFSESHNGALLLGVRLGFCWMMRPNPLINIPSMTSPSIVAQRTGSFSGSVARCVVSLFHTFKPQRKHFQLGQINTHTNRYNRMGLVIEVITPGGLDVPQG
jgi:hypothetical protein